MNKSESIRRALHEIRNQLGRPVLPEDPQAFNIYIQGTHSNWTTTCGVLGDTLVQVSSLFPITVATQDRLKTTEYIMRANAELTFGTLVMNVDTGRIRFRTTISTLVTTEITAHAVGRLIATNVFLVDHYLEGLQSMLFGGLAPSDALSRLNASLNNDEEDMVLEELLEDVDLDHLNSVDGCA